MPNVHHVIKTAHHVAFNMPWTRIGDLLIGAAGSMLAVLILWLLSRGRNFFWLRSASRHIAERIRQEGVSCLHLSREDYQPSRGGTGSLSNYLNLSTTSIQMISVSLRVTNDENDLVKLFEKKLNSEASFKVAVSLLDPVSPAAGCIAASLGLDSDAMREEIFTMLDKLIYLKARMHEDSRKRLRVMIHETLPMGSAIMLDATPNSGRIQVETKLYRSPRSESFGYEVLAPSPFFSRNYEAWEKLVSDSREVDRALLDDMRQRWKSLQNSDNCEPEPASPSSRPRPQTGRRGRR